jgi:hypothetical protein
MDVLNGDNFSFLENIEKFDNTGTSCVVLNYSIGCSLFSQSTIEVQCGHIQI